MTDSIALVEQTWAIAATVEGVTDTFYARLWELRPDFKTTLFGRANMKAQAKMLASTIDVAVKHLRKPDVLIPVLKDLGKRHCQYGVRPEDYAPVAEALLWTLKHYLGAKYTPAVEAAWTEVLTTIATTMGGECNTAEGKRMLAEYEAKYPVPNRKGAAAAAAGPCCSPALLIGGAIAVAAVAYLVLRARK